MSASFLIVREHPLPGGGCLVVAVERHGRRPPLLNVAVFRDGQPRRTMLVHPDAFDALQAVLDAHRDRVPHVEEVPGWTAVLRLEAKDGEIILSRHMGETQRGRARVVRSDEVPALQEALFIAREGSGQ